MITTDGFRWSFSKLTCYEQCPLGFKLRYLDDVPQEDNAFAEFGSFCHMLLENWARGDLMSFELADTYTRLFDDAVIHHFPPFPPGMGQRYFDAGLAYFTNFDGFGDQYKVLAVEDRFQINIHGFPFTGVSDLVLEDRRNGDLLVVDHKSKSAKVMHRIISSCEHGNQGNYRLIFAPV